MYRFQKIDTSIPTVNAQLFANEDVLDCCTSVGLYDGKEKDLTHDNGSLYLTTHRLIYVDALRPHHNSCHLDLSFIRQTEYWAGFLKSSPKITLTLGESALRPLSSASSSAANAPNTNDSALPASAQAWVCRICGFSNSPSSKCTLCGVARDLGTATNQPSRSSTPVAPSSVTPIMAPTKIDASETRIPCPTCTFLNHPSMSRCEVCDSTLGTAGLSSRANKVDLSNATGYVRLSFRKGGEKNFYAALKTALLDKVWENMRGNRQHRVMVDGESVVVKETVTIGIDGILKTIDLNTQGQTSEMQDALQDLNALMLKAKDMVSLAQSLNAKLPSSTNAQDSETSTIVKSSLVKLGLGTPALTQDMVKDEQEYHEGLARELASLLTTTRKGSEPLMSDNENGKGIMPIEEIWCIWNRARGISLVSPKDFRAACPHLPTYTWPSVQLRTFTSGLTVLHTHRFADVVFADRLAPILASSNTGLSTLEVAKREHLSVGLASEMLESIEQSTEAVCRDEQAKDGLRWCANLILGYVWEDPN